MSIFWLPLLLALGQVAWSQTACTGTHLTPEDVSQGWHDLASPDQWTGGIGKPLPGQAWKFENGCIALVSPNKGGSIFSAREFDNFELVFDWAIAQGGNSGVKYMGVRGRRHPDIYKYDLNPSARTGTICLVLLLGVLLAVWRRAFRVKWALWIALASAFLLADGVCYSAARWFQVYQNAKYYPTGLEYQIIDNDRHSDGKLPTHRTGALYDMLVPENAEPLPPGTFNQSRIIVNGNHAEHWLNGRRVVSYDFGSEQLKAAIAQSKFARLPDMATKSAGYLELQNHGAQIWFRNFRIRELPESR